MRMRRCWMSALGAAMLALAGCQPLKIEETRAVAAGEVMVLKISPPRYEQKVTVQVSSPGAPVSVYVVRESESQTAQDLMMKEKAPSSPLAGKEKAEEIRLEATVPAKMGFAVVIRADKKNAEVKIKVTGR